MCLIKTDSDECRHVNLITETDNGVDVGPKIDGIGWDCFNTC